MDKIPQIKTLTLCAGLLLTSACTTPLEKTPERTMNVSAGPEQVFERPVAEIIPQLSGAAATGVNGRVGNEMVFWGFRLPDNSRVNLFACAMLDDVNCEARLGLICPGGGQELTRVTESGLVRHLNCRAVGFAAVGDLRPNCDDSEKPSDVLVGLMQCR